MATKGERFKAEQQRAAQAGRVQESGHDSAGKRAAARGRIKGRLPNPASHNEGARAARNSSYQFETSATARPSRKSTRKGATRTKTDAALRIAAMNRNAAPRNRAVRRGGNPT